MCQVKMEYLSTWDKLSALKFQQEGLDGAELSLYGDVCCQLHRRDERS